LYPGKAEAGVSPHFLNSPIFFGLRAGSKRGSNFPSPDVARPISGSLRPGTCRDGAFGRRYSVCQYLSEATRWHVACVARAVWAGNGAVPSMSTFCLPHSVRSVHQQMGDGKPFAEKNNARNHFTTESTARPTATQEIQPRINTDGHGSEVIAHPCPSVSIRGKNSSRKCTTLNYCVPENTKTGAEKKFFHVILVFFVVKYFS